MESRRKNGVFEAIRMAAVTHRLLTAGTVLCAAASVAASLVPPLLLARIIDGLTALLPALDDIDGLTAGLPLTFPAVLLYFGSLALEGMLSSAQESLLVLFGQKMTHALRSEMSRKLTKLPASTLVGQNPGEVAARFSGDVDTVEALFTSGIISMAADGRRPPPHPEARRHHQRGGAPLPHPLHHGGHRREEYRPCADFAAGAAAVRRVHPPCADADAGSAAG